MWHPMYMAAGAPMPALDGKKEWFGSAHATRSRFDATLESSPGGHEGTAERGLGEKLGG